MTALILERGKGVTLNPGYLPQAIPVYLSGYKELELYDLRCIHPQVLVHTTESSVVTSWAILGSVTFEAQPILFYFFPSGEGGVKC